MPSSTSVPKVSFIACEVEVLDCPLTTGPEFHPTATFRTGRMDECESNGSVTFDCFFVPGFLSFSVLSSAVLKLAVRL